MPNVYQSSFAGGELKPSLRQRVDISKYGVSCQALLNYQIHPGGGASNRGGTRFINRVKNSANNTRLISFQFNTEQAYSLEFGDQYMRVLKDGGLVLESAKTITAITQADPGVVTSAAHGFANGEEVFIADVLGMVQVNGSFYLTANVAANTFELQNLDGTDIDTSVYEAYTSGGTVSKVFEIETPYLHTDVALLKFTQSADIMTFTHPSYLPRELKRTGHASWALDIIEFNPTVGFPTGLAAAVGVGTGTLNVTYKYKVTAVEEETLEESLPAINGTTATIISATQADPVVIGSTAHGFNDGDEVYIASVVGMIELNGNRYTVANKAVNTFELKDIDGTGFTAYISGGTAARTHAEVINNLTTALNTNVITWTEEPDAFKYNIYKDDNGIYGYIGSTETLTFTDDNIEPELNDTPPRSRNPFEGTDNYPGAVELWQQRRNFARTNNKRETIFTSQTSNYANMNVSSPAKADDAVTLALAGKQSNEIRHLLDLGDLIALTAGAEWSINGADGQPLQPDTRKAVRETAYGCSNVPPIVIGKSAIFNQARGKKIYDLKYSFEANGYDGNDLSIFASHLFKKTRNQDKRLKEWCYQQEPDSLVWCVHNDGTMSSLTYHLKHQVIAFARHETLGQFKSICCIPEDDVDRVYMIVERLVNGNTYQYLEVMENRDIEEDNLEYAFFVDCGTTIEGNGKETITGLNWLEGFTVAIWADGNELEPQIVVDGAVTLNKVYTTVTIGLPYNCDLQPLDIEVNGPQGTTKGKLKKVNKVFIQVYNMRGIKVASKDPNGQLDPDEVVNFEPFKQREWEDYDEPTRLKTGIIELSVDSTWQQRAAPYLRHDSPSPITILGIVPQVEISD